MKRQVLYTVCCNISGEAAGEIDIDHSWEWKGSRTGKLIEHVKYTCICLIELAPGYI